MTCSERGKRQTRPLGLLFFPPGQHFIFAFTLFFPCWMCILRFWRCGVFFFFTALARYFLSLTMKFQVRAWGELGVLLPEQPMRPIYLSSTWGIEAAYLLQKQKRELKKKRPRPSSTFHLGILFLSSSKPSCLFFFLHLQNPKSLIMWDMILI